MILHFDPNRPRAAAQPPADAKIEPPANLTALDILRLAAAYDEACGVVPAIQACNAATKYVERTLLNEFFPAKGGANRNPREKWRNGLEKLWSAWMARQHAEMRAAYFAGVSVGVNSRLASAAAALPQTSSFPQLIATLTELNAARPSATDTLLKLVTRVHQRHCSQRGGA